LNCRLIADSVKVLKTLKWDVKLTAEIETDSVNGGPDKANYTGKINIIFS